MICRGVSEASSDMMPLPIQILSFSGSPFGQNRFAIAWLMRPRSSGGIVVLVERPPAHHRDFENLEVSRRDRLPSATTVEWTCRAADPSR